MFSCLGTTIKAARSKAAQWKVDYDYQYAFAKAARINNTTQMVLVSADFASSASIFFYAKMKGKLEEAVCRLNYKTLHVFRPPFLVRKDTDRFGEKWGYRFFQLLHRVGMMQSQRPVPTEVLAKAMVNVSKTKDEGEHFYRGKEIWKWAEGNI